MIKVRTGSEATGIKVAWVISGIAPKPPVDFTVAWLCIQGVDVEATIGNGSMDGNDVVMMVALAAPMDTLALDARDIHVVGGTIDPVRSGFPWRLEPGVRKRFLLYIRPQTIPLKVNLGGYVFEISREGGEFREKQQGALPISIAV